MEKNVFIKNTEITSDNSDEVSFNRNRISRDKTGLKQVFPNLVSSTGIKISNLLNEIRRTRKPGVRLLYTVFMFSLTIIEEVILLALLIVYFIIGATAVILYMIFYERIYEKLILKFKKQPDPSLSDCVGDYSNLNLDCKEQ